MIEQAFDELAGSLPEPTILVGPDKRILRVNTAACALLRRRREDLQDLPLAQLIADTPDRIEPYLRQCRRSRQPLPGRLTWQSDGQAVTMRCDGSAVRTHTGTSTLLRLRPNPEAITRFTELNRHIERLTLEVRRRRLAETRQQEQNIELAAMNDELQAAEEELRQQNDAMAAANEELQATEEELRQQNAELIEANLRVQAERYRYQELFDFAPEGYIVSNSTGRIIEANRAASKLAGLPADQLIGISLADFLPDFGWQDVQQLLNQQERNAIAVGEWELEFQPRDGEAIPVAISVSIIRNHSGEPVGYRWMIKDITQRKQYEQQIREARDSAEAANHAKDHFLAVLSHELRTPLTPVLLTTSALRKEPTVPESLREDLEMIHQNVELEVRLIDDLLDLTRIQRGKFDLQRQAVHIHSLLQRCLKILDDDVQSRSLNVSLRLDAPADCVSGDPARLQQVFWNILRNAVKFTPRNGRIDIHTAGDAQAMKIEITDTGVGIEPAVLPRIFDAFEQGDTEVTRAFGGLGLGLCISRALAEMHGGTVTAFSEGHNRGSTFTVELPLVVPSHARGPRHGELPAAPHRRLRILLVEDHETTARVMSRLLSRMGHEIRVAGNVAEALQYGQAEPPDLLISDLGLPDGSGHEVMRTLRERYGVPGIALSGFGMERDKAESLKAGFTAHLTKPADLYKLESLIRQIGQRLDGADTAALGGDIEC